MHSLHDAKGKNLRMRNLSIVSLLQALGIILICARAQCTFSQIFCTLRNAARKIDLIKKVALSCNAGHNMCASDTRHALENAATNKPARAEI